MIIDFFTRTRRDAVLDFISDVEDNMSRRSPSDWWGWYGVWALIGCLFTTPFGWYSLWAIGQLGLFVIPKAVIVSAISTLFWIASLGG